MTRDLRSAILVALVLAASCTPPEPKTPSSASGTSAATTEAAPLVIRTTISYTRSGLFPSAGRPTGFGLIRDYHSADASVETFSGAWNDATQTLTADVTVALKSENLVYVDDPAITPGSETPMRAGRSGQLHEIACPETVQLEHACYLLQVLR